MAAQAWYRQGRSVQNSSCLFIAAPLSGCGDLIAALDECHSRGLMARMTGACNDIKHQLNMCLREEVGRQAGGSTLHDMTLIYYYYFASAAAPREDGQACRGEQDEARGEEEDLGKD